MLQCEVSVQMINVCEFEEVLFADIKDTGNNGIEHGVMGQDVKLQVNPIQPHFVLKCGGNKQCYVSDDIYIYRRLFQSHLGITAYCNDFQSFRLVSY